MAITKRKLLLVCSENQSLLESLEQDFSVNRVETIDDVMSLPALDAVDIVFVVASEGGQNRLRMQTTT